MDYREDFTLSSYSYENCKYIIVDVVDFLSVFRMDVFPEGFFDPNQRFNVDNSKTFIKSNGDFLDSELAKYPSYQGPYTFAEMSGIINTPEWTSSV